MNLEVLRRQLRGSLVTPESAEYESCRREWNAMIDRRPKAIACCNGPDAADDAPNIEWARKFHAGMERWSAHLVYVNALDQDDQDRVAQAYGANYKRLCDVKNKYDPENLFRRNQNICPQPEPAVTAIA